MEAHAIREQVIPEIKDKLTYVAVGYPIRDLGDEVERLSEYFQALGISYLLGNNDQERFRENLVRSGHARRYFLRKSREESNDDDHRLALGRTEAFLDSLAAGHLGLAREIAGLSIATWHSDWEYEDDFCFYLFLHRLVTVGTTAGRADLALLLVRFERVLEGEDSPRLDACKALVDRNTDAFRDALAALMEKRNEEMEEARDRNHERDPAASVCWARSFVSIEGLALLRVAELAGLAPLAPNEELQLCPGPAVLPVGDRDYLDMFVRIERELARGR